MPAAGDPDVASAQPIAQFRQHAELVMAPVDGAAGQDVGRPALPHEPGRRGFRQAGPRAVSLAQHHDRAHQRGAGGHALEIERVQEGRGPAPDASIMLAKLLVASNSSGRASASASATVARNRSHGIKVAIAP